MIELTGIDPTAYRIETWKVFVMLDQVTRVSEYSDRGRNYARIHFTNGESVIVTESAETVSNRIRVYAENVQRERVEAVVDARIDRLLKNALEGGVVARGWRGEAEV